MHAFSGFYNKFPHTRQEKVAILDFLELEQECDEWNERQINLILSSGECDPRKTRQKQALAATKRWSRENRQFLKYYSSVEPKSMAPVRSWYHEA